MLRTTYSKLKGDDAHCGTLGLETLNFANSAQHISTKQQEESTKNQYKSGNTVQSKDKNPGQNFDPNTIIKSAHLSSTSSIYDLKKSRTQAKMVHKRTSREDFEFEILTC